MKPEENKMKIEENKENKGEGEQEEEENEDRSPLLFTFRSSAFPLTIIKEEVNHSRFFKQNFPFYQNSENCN